MTTPRECPNPKCRSDDIQTYPCDFGGGTAWPDSWRVECSKCELTGPVADTEAAAIELWNLLPRELEWLPIETAPTDGTLFCGFDAYGEYQIARMDEGMFRSYETGKRVDLIAWVPLPPPPVIAGEQERE